MRSLAGYSPRGSKRVWHDWETKQQQIWLTVAENIVRTTDAFLTVLIEHCLFSWSGCVYMPYAGFTHKHTQIHSLSSVPLLPFSIPPEPPPKGQFLPGSLVLWFSYTDILSVEHASGASSEALSSHFVSFDRLVLSNWGWVPLSDNGASPAPVLRVHVILSPLPPSISCRWERSSVCYFGLLSLGPETNPN